MATKAADQMSQVTTSHHHSFKNPDHPCAGADFFTWPSSFGSVYGDDTLWYSFRNPILGLVGTTGINLAVR